MHSCLHDEPKTPAEEARVEKGKVAFSITFPPPPSSESLLARYHYYKVIAVKWYF